MRKLSWSVAAALCAALVGALVIPPASGQDTKDKDPTLRDLDAYRLRVGDKVEILVYNGSKLTVETSAKLSVPGNGDVSMPPIGKIHLLDRTVFEVQEAVTAKFKDEGFLAVPNVTCVITDFEPRPVYLMGAVQGVVYLPVHRNMRILEVLAKAGTLGHVNADFTHVRVRRVGPDGKSFPFEVNVDDILERNQDQQNIVIFENDIIIVPRLDTANPNAADWVYVLGKVHGPGRQPIIKGRTAFTLTKLIAICGDFLEFADRTKVKIIRSTPTGREQYVVDFDDIIEGKLPDFEMKPDDLVYVPENWI
jgi:protein involved in polysaccharide export with SLBB domain